MANRSLILGILLSVFILSCKKNDIATPSSNSGSGSENGNGSGSGSGNGSSTSYPKTSAPQGLNIGNAAPEFTQNDANGKPVTLASFRGKYLLLDFWASWCGPCIASMPQLATNYNRFKGQTVKDANGVSVGFDVLGVSLDQSKSSWLQAISGQNASNTKLIWNQVSDLGYWNNAAAKLYNISGIPSQVLIDPSGKIIDNTVISGGYITHTPDVVGDLTKAGFK